MNAPIVYMEKVAFMGGVGPGGFAMHSAGQHQMHMQHMQHIQHMQHNRAGEEQNTTMISPDSPLYKMMAKIRDKIMASHAKEQQ